MKEVECPNQCGYIADKEVMSFITCPKSLSVGQLTLYVYAKGLYINSGRFTLFFTSYKNGHFGIGDKRTLASNLSVSC